jgi:hypothetical protein
LDWYDRRCPERAYDCHCAKKTSAIAQGRISSENFMPAAERVTSNFQRSAAVVRADIVFQAVPAFSTIQDNALAQHKRKL